jgi:hypothetical protein
VLIYVLLITLLLTMAGLLLTQRYYRGCLLNLSTTESTALQHSNVELYCLNNLKQVDVSLFLPMQANNVGFSFSGGGLSLGAGGAAGSGSGGGASGGGGAGVNLNLGLGGSSPATVSNAEAEPLAANVPVSPMSHAGPY